MNVITPRHFLFLQGPHGPFFRSLARQLIAAGAKASRVGFNAGDAFFWRGLPGYQAVHGGSDALEDVLKKAFEGGVTDIVCYGARRPVHVLARRMAKAQGVTVHAFEEGYLRPYWVTYERDGTNAASRLNAFTLMTMRAALDTPQAHSQGAPDTWGNMRQHVFWGAVYHAALIAGRRRYPNYRSHRSPEPSGEFLIYLKHLLTMPLRRLRRRIATRRIRNATFPYHVVLCQLAHDANFRDNSDFESQADFLGMTLGAFSQGAPPHHHLVVKAHPLEDGRESLPHLFKALAKTNGLTGRVHLVTGGKLAQLLDRAQSAVTVNSTAAEQVLWRGLPLKAFGRATYNRPEFVSDQPLADFFAAPRRPDSDAYSVYREFLLASSQIPGGFYAQSPRNQLLRRLPDLMHAPVGPYETLVERPASARQHIRLVT